MRWFAADELPELQHETVSALVALASSALGPVATVRDGRPGRPRRVGPDGDGAALRPRPRPAAGQLTAGSGLTARRGGPGLPVSG